MSSLVRTVVASLALSLTVPAIAEACGTVRFHAEILSPPADAGPMPLDAPLLAIVDAPGSPQHEVALVRVSDGSPVAVSVDVQSTINNEKALVIAQPAGLEPDTAYLWTVGSFERSFTTGDAPDPAIPSVGALEITFTGAGVEPGCFGEELPYDGYEVVITSVSEPVASYAIAGDLGEPSNVWPGEGTTLELRARSPEEACFEVMVMDRGGHLVSAGEACLPGLDEEGSTGGSTGGDDTGADDTGAPPPSPTTGSEETDGPDAADGSSGDATGVPQDDDQVSDRGCSCRSTTHARPRWALLAVLLLGVGRRRRRSPRHRVH